MKKKWILALVFCLALCSLTGCAGEREEDTLSVVAVIFPEYDWVRQIIGADSGIELHLLVDDGVDPHSFQPSVADMVKVSECDLLIYGGGESDAWVADALKGTEKATVALLPLLGDQAHQEEVVAGMQVHDPEDETDEHVWMSLPNAALFCTAITEELVRLAPHRADTFRANLAAYLNQLSTLDEAYRQTVDNAEKDTIVVCDRFPYRYLTEDYGLNYYAAFPGCSAETGASFETVVFLSDRVKELDLNALIITETSDGRLAKTVAENAGRGDMPILTLNSMQSVSGEQAKKTDYLSIMEANRQVLEQALG